MAQKTDDLGLFVQSIMIAGFVCYLVMWIRVVLFICWEDTAWTKVKGVHGSGKAQSACLVALPATPFDENHRRKQINTQHSKAGTCSGKTICAPQRCDSCLRFAVQLAHIVSCLSRSIWHLAARFATAFVTGKPSVFVVWHWVTLGGTGYGMSMMVASGF